MVGMSSVERRPGVVAPVSPVSPVPVLTLSEPSLQMSLQVRT